MSTAPARIADHSDGDPPAGDGGWRLLQRLPSQIEASLLEGMLAEHGIRSVVESVFFSQEPTSFGALGEFRVHVLEADFGCAEDLVREVAETPPGATHLELL